MPSIALPVSLRGQLLSGSRFNPISLFSAGEQGIWLDPSDLTTMFTDRAGTTPVTTPGQTVGKRLDKSGRGNHAVAPTDAARPTYGIEPKTGRRNLLTRTEEFGDAVWTKANLTVSANAGVAPDGTTTADRLVESAANIGRGTYFTNTTTVSGNTTWSVYLKAAERNFGGLTAIDGGNNRYYLVANLTNGAEIASGSASGSPSLVSKSIISVGNGWYRLQITLNSVSGATNFGWVYPQDDATFATESTGNTIYQGDGTSGILIWGAQLELGSTATAYQRVGTAFDVTEAGVPTVHYVQYDGTDDSFSTSSINFTATDKMSVFAGFRRLDSANSLKVLVELSAATASNNGSFYLSVPEDSGPTPYSSLGAYLRGTGTMSRYGTLSYPTNSSHIETLLFDLSRTTASTAITPRVNGVDGYQNSSSIGTNTATTFGNYPLFIGRRGNVSNPFNGRDYGIIVVGKTASASEITNTESYLAANTSGVTL